MFPTPEPAPTTHTLGTQTHTNLFAMTSTTCEHHCNNIHFDAWVEMGVGTRVVIVMIQIHGPFEGRNARN